MTQFIVHMGPHKTGTTYLQESFAHNRSLLAERGIHFPTIWGPVAHHALFDGLLVIPNPKLQAQFAALHAEGHQTVLISVEGLAELREASVAFFHDLVGAGHQVRCIYYARAWRDLLPSRWKEMIKGGETFTLPEYLYTRLHNPTASFIVNFGVGLRLWQKYFGPGAVSIVAYDQLVAQKIDLFEHFATRFLGWPQPPRLEVSAVNVSPGMADIEAIRAIAALERLRLGEAPSQRYAGALAQGYIRRKDDLVTPCIAAALAGHTTSLFINETNPGLLALHRGLMAEFGDALVGPRLPNYFFRPRRAEIRCVHPNWLLADGVLEDLKAIGQLLRAEAEATERRGQRP